MVLLWKKEQAMGNFRDDHPVCWLKIIILISSIADILNHMPVRSYLYYVQPLCCINYKSYPGTYRMVMLVRCFRVHKKSTLFQPTKSCCNLSHYTRTFVPALQYIEYVFTSRRDWTTTRSHVKIPLFHSRFV